MDHHLGRFVQDPGHFRSQMGKYDALVSGGLATQFFERAFWKDSGLDIFIQQRERAGPFGNYLADVEGYVLIRIKHCGK